MSAPFNGLKPDEAELLALLAEECAEVVQAARKILRHVRERQDELRHQGEALRLQAKSRGVL